MKGIKMTDPFDHILEPFNQDTLRYPVSTYVELYEYEEPIASPFCGDTIAELRASGDFAVTAREVD